MFIATSNFLIPNGTFVVELIAFVIVLGVLAKFVLPLLNEKLSERQDKIRSELAAADEAKADAQAADDERKAELDRARQQAREIVAQAHRTADNVVAEAEQRASVEYARLVSNADTAIAMARQKALDEASARLGQLMVDVVGRILAREIDAEARRDLIDAAISALREESGALSDTGSGV